MSSSPKATAAVGSAQQACKNCQTSLKWEVLSGSGGWFVGTVCHEPSCVNINRLVERASHYYESQVEATRALHTGTVRWLMGHGTLSTAKVTSF